MIAPTEIYEQAADAIAAGRFREGSRLAYEAAFAATVDAAARHNAPCASDADAGEFLIWLDNPPFPWRNGTSTTTPRAKICCPYLSSPRDSAWRFPYRKHAETLAKQPDGYCALYWDEDEYALYLTAVKGLINDPQKRAPQQGAFMDCQAHLKEARNLAAQAATLNAEGEYLIAGELIWGATVHAVSTADPEHETQPPDRHGNPHQAPNTSVTFTAAARRIIGSPFTERDIVQCLDNGQRGLHNHFYHMTNSEQNLRRRNAIGAAYVQRLIRIAGQSLKHTTPQTE